MLRKAREKASRKAKSEAIPSTETRLNHGACRENDNLANGRWRPARFTRMNTLRWFLVIATALATIGFLALLTLADGFRRSFGASENGPWMALLPLLAAGLFLAALLWPEPRALRHAAAVVVLILTAGSIWILRESAFIGSVGLLYSGLWGLWYWQAVWQQASGPVP